MVETGIGYAYKRKTKKICELLRSTDLGAKYVHLNESTASRHVFMAFELSPIGVLCHHHIGQAVSITLLERMQWIVHEHFRPKDSGTISAW